MPLSLPPFHRALGCNFWCHDEDRHRGTETPQCQAVLPTHDSSTIFTTHPKSTLPEDTQVFLDDNTRTTHFKPRLTMPHTMPGAYTGRPKRGSNQRTPAPRAGARPLYYDDGYPYYGFGIIPAEPHRRTQTFKSNGRLNWGSNQRSPALRASARPLYYDVGYPKNGNGPIPAEPPVHLAQQSIP